MILNDFRYSHSQSDLMMIKETNSRRLYRYMYELYTAYIARVPLPFNLALFLVRLQHDKSLYLSHVSSWRITKWKENESWKNGAKNRERKEWAGWKEKGREEERKKESDRGGETERFVTFETTKYTGL